ncbi:MAG: hypothetical protein A2Y03_01510 [Omnitrophica WOR_2 bacterium GWF2_38_59]|nr:MAG: hypothetical protein A2Y06_06535 [Omnitrophica WOR_2 bacterium GWA2_37_7]OGX26365.1 MAG: hypothetical protein A2Y03_01510 [Omnitrophica WOR_2 bacterium GWF2_38_59]OGX46634.1 MAG: hypothetical protein A2243_04110 [Omnitrophica WOR_2 bacterium RIFOXYA2_FULL_38_17]OGX54471.1 MAG: hypothetical protein A2267_07220 [Omnitrophica WOR_2 bacterium RIFOXYA12_FULL_38_10]OGX55556.1 MAG: hypothetical protein A2447_05285 [Omnitrophica WOR_2 bacterium RIFOXYC2_FULL_38_12]OGX59411.1 MAG: hypothetical 
MSSEKQVKICVSCSHENPAYAQRCENCKSIVLNAVTVVPEDKGTYANSLFVNGVPAVLIIVFLFFAVRYYINRSEYDPTIRIKDIDELEYVLKSEQKPVLVYFYYKSYDRSPKYMLPALDRLNYYIGTRIPIYRYRFQKDDDLLISKYGKADGTFVVFNKGQPVKSMSTSSFFKIKDPSNAGQIFLFIRDELNLRELNRFEETELEYLNSETFYKKVIEAPNPVVVNFTRSSCPAANRFRGFYKAMANSYDIYADFYYVDTSKEKEIAGLFSAWATPTVIIYNNGNVVGRYNSAYSDQYTNDSRLFGYLFTLLVDDIML